MRSLLSTVDVADRPILDRARQMYRDQLAETITGSIVRDLNSRYGTDLATAVLYAHFESKLLSFDAQTFREDSAVDPRKPLLVAVVPGAFYQEHPEIGADGRDLIQLSQREGWQCERVETESLGTLRHNAAIIQEYLRRKVRSHRVILVSLSKGTLDAATARSLDPRLFAELFGWVSVSGVPRGTQMADWLLDRWRLRPIFGLMLWYHGADKQAVRDLRHGATQALDMPTAQMRYPMIHVSSFPLRRHLSCWRARLWHRRFRSEGPNDSVVMLEDLLHLPGIVIPVWGADHYLQGEWNVPHAVSRIVALLDGQETADDERAA